MVLQTVFWTHKLAIGPIDMGNSESLDPYAQNCKHITGTGNCIQVIASSIPTRSQLIFLRLFHNVKQ